MAELNHIIQFIEAERVLQKIHKNALCAQADITPQYYDLLLKSRSTAGFEVVAKLLQVVGYDLAVIKKLNLNV